MDYDPPTATDKLTPPPRVRQISLILPPPPGVSPAAIIQKRRRTPQPKKNRLGQTTGLGAVGGAVGEENGNVAGGIGSGGGGWAGLGSNGMETPSIINCLYPLPCSPPTSTAQSFRLPNLTVHNTNINIDPAFLMAWVFTMRCIFCGNMNMNMNPSYNLQATYLPYRVCVCVCTVLCGVGVRHSLRVSRALIICVRTRTINDKTHVQNQPKTNTNSKATNNMKAKASTPNGECSH